MIEDELIRIWKSSSNQERVRFEKSRLMIELQSSLDNLNRWWKFGVRVEIIAACIAIPIFAFITYWTPFTTSKIASVLIILYVLFVISRLIGVKRFKPSDLESDYLKYLGRSRAYLQAQANLLENFKYWGMMPLYPIIFLFVFNFWELPSKRMVIIIVFLSMFGMHIYTYFLQRKKVQNEIKPQILRVDAVIESLKE